MRLGAGERRTLWTVAAALIAVFAAVYVYEEAIGALPGESRILEWRAGLVPFSGPVLRALSGVINLGDEVIAAATTVLLAAVMLEEKGRRAAAGVAAAATIVLFVALFKRIAGPTPLAVTAEPNFPSGHTAYATAVLGFAAWTALRDGHRSLAALAAAPAAAMGPALVLYGSHAPSDVIAGYAVGAAWMIGAALLTSRQPEARSFSRATSTGPRRP